MGECGGLPKGWEYVSLGMGNNLFVSSEVYDYFKALVNYLPSESHPYQTWMTCALMTLILLDEGFTDKEKFLEKAKEISLEQNSAEIPIIEVWNRYIHYSHKFNEGFKAISLDKIDNPNYIEQKQREIEDRKKQRFYRILAFIIVFIIVLIYLIFLR